METVRYIVELAYDHQIPVIINPAPYQEIPEDILTKTTLFTPNEGEAFVMSKIPEFEFIKNKMIITKGKHGSAFFASSGEMITIPAYPVPVKDTTGAGDTFNAALAVELASGNTLGQAITFANAAAAISVGEIGAQGGMPSKKEVDDFLMKNKN